MKSLIKATKRLEDMPYSGRIVPEFENENFREVIYRNYRIVYRLVGKNKDVEILAVVHGARDMRGLFPGEEWELELFNSVIRGQPRMARIGIHCCGLR